MIQHVRGHIEELSRIDLIRVSHDEFLKRIDHIQRLALFSQIGKGRFGFFFLSFSRRHDRLDHEIPVFVFHGGDAEMVHTDTVFGAIGPGDLSVPVFFFRKRKAVRKASVYDGIGNAPV